MVLPLAHQIQQKDSRGLIPFNATIQNIKIEHVKIIYKKGYWDVVQADSLPHPLDLILFDSAVNHGPNAPLNCCKSH